MQTVGAGVDYRLVVSNVGTGGLTNIRVSDTDLSIQDVLASNLLTYGQSVTVTAATPGFQNLDQIGRCTAAGDLLNTAMVTASARSNPALVVSAQDPAWVKCEPVVAGNPAIEIKKQITLDDDANATWSDADTLDNPLQGTFPQDVSYRLLITNTGDETLGNLIVDDATLGLNNISLGGGLWLLEPNNMIALEGSVAGFEALKQPNRCTAAGTFTNTARVSATSQVHGAPVSDDDAAILVCFGTPEIDLQKKVSVDGGITWLDADTDAEAAAAQVGSGVRYRFVITNVGAQAIGSLSINDPSLGVDNFAFPGTPNPGESIYLDSFVLPQLDQPNRCASAGNVTNTATVSGTSVNTNTAVSDTDSAVVRCESSPAAANCTVCSQLGCLVPSTPAPVDCASGQDVCAITIKDETAGREIDRACAVRADALATAGQNPRSCDNLGNPLAPGEVCTFVCDGVTNPNCNRPPTILPAEGEITP